MKIIIIILLLFNCVNCFSNDTMRTNFVSAITQKDKQAIIQQIADKTLNEIWSSFNVVENPVLKLIDQNDFNFLGFLIDNNFPKSYWDASLGHDGEWASFPYYCLKTNNYKALKYLYEKGMRLTHESIDVRLENEQLYEDVRLALYMGCEQKIIDFLIENEKKPNKRYIIRNGSGGELDNETILFGIDNDVTFEHIITKMKLHSIINAFSLHYNPELNRKTVLDQAIEKKNQKIISIIKKYGGQTTRELLLKMNKDDLSKLVYRKGYINTNALIMREMPTKESNKILTLRSGAEIGVISIDKWEEIDGISSHWYLITFENNAGYCFGGYLKLSNYAYDLYEEANKF